MQLWTLMQRGPSRGVFSHFFASEIAMRVSVNGQPADVPDGVTIDQLLEIVDVPPNYLAVEVNEDVVPRGQHASHQLADGDRVEVVTLVGGG